MTPGKMSPCKKSIQKSQHAASAGVNFFVKKIERPILNANVHRNLRACKTMDTADCARTTQAHAQRAKTGTYGQKWHRDATRTTQHCGHRTLCQQMEKGNFHHCRAWIYADERDFMRTRLAYGRHTCGITTVQMWHRRGMHAVRLRYRCGTSGVCSRTGVTNGCLRCSQAKHCVLGSLPCWCPHQCPSVADIEHSRSKH